MTEIHTSRNTVIKKQLAVVEQATFPLDDITNAGGEFINELNEIYRFLGLNIDTAYIRDVFSPNVDGLKQDLSDRLTQAYQEFQDGLAKQIQEIIPVTGNSQDPIIIRNEAGEHIASKFELTVSYHKAPYTEKPIAQLTDQTQHTQS